MFKNEKNMVTIKQATQDLTKFRVKTQRSYSKLQQKPYNQCYYKCTKLPLASIPPLLPPSSTHRSQQLLGGIRSC